MLPAGTVAEFGDWIEDRWLWKFSWVRELSAEEEEAAALLQNSLQQICPALNSPDRWVWLHSSLQQFTVKSAYKRLIRSSDGSDLQEGELKILMKLWDTEAPSKYLVHGWRLLIDRLPTRLLLH